MLNANKGRGLIDEAEDTARLSTEADKITIERGYGKELLAERKTSLKRWSKNKTRLHQKTKVYLSPQEIQRLLN